MTRISGNVRKALQVLAYLDRDVDNLPTTAPVRRSQSFNRRSGTLTRSYHSGR